MIRNASLFLAMRYLKPKQSFLSIITFLSILGPILGVAVLIVVISVMAGFNRDIREKILGMQAHIQLKHALEIPIENYENILDKLNSMGITCTPVVEGPVLIQTRKQILAKFIKGILPHTEENVSDLYKSVSEGKYEISEDEVLIGKDLALQCNLRIGDKILIHSPDKLNKMIEINDDGAIQQKETQEIYTPEELTIAGFFSMGMYQYDSSILILHIEKAGELFGLDWNSATSIHIRTDEPFNLPPIIDRIEKEMMFSHLIPITWQQSNQRLFGALRVEKNLMFFLLIFIMIVAAFGITATLITIVIQKTREIGVLKAIGASPIDVLMIFIIQGGVVGFTGTTLGTALGLVIIENRNFIAGILAKITGTEIFPKDLYHLSQIPALVQPSDLLAIVISSFFICITGALIPALYAAKLTPVNALKNEM